MSDTPVIVQPGVALPEPFDFNKPQDWDTYKSRFNRYCIVAGVTNSQQQVNSLLYAMGPRAETIFTSFNLSEADAEDIVKVREKFDGFFNGRKNIIYERAKFNMRVQSPGESMEDFITDLCKLADSCEYRDFREQLIRDRIVVGVADRRLSERLQLLDGLDYKKAVEIARSYETVQKQNQMLRSEVAGAGTVVNRVQGKTKARKRKNFFTPWKCFGCGNEKMHKKEECPARNSKCNKCAKEGHWAKVCKSKRTDGSSEKIKPKSAVRQVEDDSRADPFFVATVSQSQTPTDELRRAKVTVDNVAINFQLDPGADVTIITDSIYKENKQTFGKLYPADCNLESASRDSMKCIGIFTARLTYGDRARNANIFVVKGIRQNLLGRGECVGLGLVMRCSQVSAQSTVRPFTEFPSLFNRLGLLKTPYKIKLRKEAKPFCLSQPRRVPLALMEKLKRKLEEMQQMKVIEKIQEPTDWCCGIVLVKKQDTDDIRFFVDLTKLNQAVEREYHPMPCMEHTLGQLKGAKYITKLDCVSGFWQIPLSEESKKLTTFITPFGRFCFCRLPFGISSAPEFFQKRVSQVLEGLEGVVNLMDNMLVWGETIQKQTIRQTSSCFISFGRKKHHLERQ
jgi:hypothetical protein